MLMHAGGLLLLMSLALLIVDPRICNAQISASATTTVTVNVVRGMSVKTFEGLNFGVSERVGEIHATSSVATNAGSFKVSGEPDASVTIAFPGTITLQSHRGDVLDFTPILPTWNTTDSQVFNRQDFPSFAGGKASLGTDGELYVWFGGSLDAENAPNGMYTGRYTITITY